MSARVELQKISIGEFRSWMAGAFEFEDGITLLTGPNGAGKSTVGMAVKYALSGKLPKLNKGDIKRIGATQGAKMRVSLTMRVDNQEVKLVRTSSQTKLTVGGDSASVREAQYLEDIRRSVEFSFLSQTAANFVDMAEFQRREMLDGLIPEVQLLRSVCHPELKTILKRYSMKRMSVAANIRQVQAMLDEQDGYLATARRNYSDAVTRHESIIAAQKASMPFDEATYAALRQEREAALKRLGELEAFINDARKWIEFVNSESTSRRAAAEQLKQLSTNKEAISAHMESLRGLMDNSKALFCPECHVELSCKSCGAVVKNTGNTAEIKANIEKLKAQSESIDAAMAHQRKYLDDSAPNMPTPELFNETRQNFNAAQNDGNVLRARVTEINAETTRYEIAEASIRAAQEAADDSVSLAALKKQFEEMEERRKELEELVVRKNRLHDKMLYLENDLSRAAEIMYSTLPLIYFDAFLQNLSQACNFLLSAISTMTVTMCTTDDGISVLVSGKKLAQLSSGELQRVRVAVTLAFSLMAVKTDTLFLDEVFDSFMDSDGTTALATLLHGTISHFYRKIVVITHSEPLMVALQPNRVMVMSKDANGNSFCEQREIQPLGIVGG